MSGLVALAGFGLLLRVADFSQLDFSSISSPLAIVPLVMLMLMIGLRGELLRCIAPADQRVNRSAWQKIVARQQLLFMLAPSWLGDASFFVLAKRYAGLDLAEITAMIALYRLRDMTVLVALGTVGGLVLAGALPLALLIAAISVMALCFMEEVASTLLRFVGRLIPSGGIADFVSRCAVIPANANRERLTKLWLVIAIWTCSALSVAAVFAAAGRPLSAAETVLLLAALNASGAVAFTIGGIGVAEVGAAGVLMLLGDSPETAAAVTLIARPLLLLSAVAASAVLILFGRFLPLPPTASKRLP
jgi:uncharacterized membrane protein YbhN (UPF0104 family)